MIISKVNEILLNDIYSLPKSESVSKVTEIYMIEFQVSFEGLHALLNRCNNLT